MTIDVSTVMIQSLRLPAGWVIVKRDFFEVDLDFKQEAVDLCGFQFECCFDDELFIASRKDSWQERNPPKQVSSLGLNVASDIGLGTHRQVSGK
jgi:hypothetical protein